MLLKQLTGMTLDLKIF